MTTEVTVIIGVCCEDNSHDVDEAYGIGTYARLFPEQLFVVRTSAPGETLFWSNESGWVIEGSDEVSFFDEHERDRLNLPLGGEWTSYEV
jgi:hypothetical protein